MRMRSINNKEKENVFSRKIRPHVSPKSEGEATSGDTRIKLRPVKSCAQFSNRRSHDISGMRFRNRCPRNKESPKCTSASSHCRTPDRDYTRGIVTRRSRSGESDRRARAHLYFTRSRDTRQIISIAPFYFSATACAILQLRRDKIQCTCTRPHEREREGGEGVHHWRAFTFDLIFIVLAGRHCRNTPLVPETFSTAPWIS